LVVFCFLHLCDTTAQAIVNMFAGWYKRLGFEGCSSNRGLTPGANLAQRGQAPISPRDARKIDLKLDDGAPWSGWITSNYGVAGDGCNRNATDYQSSNQRNCVMLFMIDG
jgi:hypothetical protein